MKKEKLSQKKLASKTTKRKEFIHKGMNEPAQEGSVNKIREAEETAEKDREDQLVELIARMLVDKVIRNVELWKIQNTMQSQNKEYRSPEYTKMFISRICCTDRTCYLSALDSISGHLFC